MHAASLSIVFTAGSIEYQGFLGKFFLAKPRSSSGYALAADKKQLRLGAGQQCFILPSGQIRVICFDGCCQHDILQVAQSI